MSMYGYGTDANSKSESLQCNIFIDSNFEKDCPIYPHRMTLLAYRIHYYLSYRQQATVQILTTLSSKDQYLGMISFLNLPKKANIKKC